MGGGLRARPAPVVSRRRILETATRARAVSPKRGRLGQRAFQRRPWRGGDIARSILRGSPGGRTAPRRSPPKRERPRVRPCPLPGPGDGPAGVAPEHRAERYFAPRVEWRMLKLPG